jgi:hypothetical protein
VKGNKYCEFHGPCPPGPRGVGAKIPKIDQFSKFFSTTTRGGKTECMVMYSKKASTKIVKFIILGVAVLPPGEGKHHIWCLLTFELFKAI